MIAIATIRLKLTITDARPTVTMPTPPRSWASPASSAMRPVRGARASSAEVIRGTSSTPPNSSAATAR